MSLRLKRLTAERDQLMAAFASSRRVSIEPDQGDPPERYQVTYRIKGLELTSAGELVSRSEHTIEVVLPADYPRRPPICKMRTPIFHPNIDRSDICTSDHWSAQETLVDLVVRIGQIITFQSYNTKSPLNADAARWCDENHAKLPVDSTDLHPAEPEAVTAERALRNAITQAEERLRRVGDAESIDVALSLVADAVRHLAGATYRNVQGPGVLLATKRDELTSTALRMEQAVKELSEWQKHNSKTIESLEVFVRLRDRLASAGSVLSRLVQLPAPAWQPEGRLDESQVVAAAAGLRAESVALTAVLQTAQAALERHTVDVTVTPLPILPNELQPLAVASKSEAAEFAPLSARKSAMDAAATVATRLESAARELDLLGECVKKYHAFVEAQSLGENLSRCKVHSSDGIDVGAGGVIVTLRAGERSNLPGIGSLTCRVPSAGGIELRDAKGEVVCLMRGLGTGWAQTSRSGVQARMLLPDAKTAYRACEAALLKLDGVGSNSSVPKPIGGVNWPHWMQDLKVPDLLSQVPGVRATLESSQRASTRRFWVSRLRTITLDVHDWQDVGTAIASEVRAADEVRQTAETALKEVIASGKMQKSGVLRLNMEQMSRFDELQTGLPALQQRVRSLLAKLLAHNSHLKPIVEKAEQMLKEAPSSDVVQSAAKDLRIALSEAVAKAQAWSRHASKALGSKSQESGVVNE